jgi:HK97 family phage prohead protease
MRPRGLEFRAFGLPHLERRRRLFGDPGIDDVDVRLSPAPLHSAASDTAGTLSGIAAPFGQRSVELHPGFVEVIAPGAFARSLSSGRDIKAITNHDSTLLLGRTGNGTLRLAETPQGLAFELQVVKTDPGFDLLRLVRRRDLHQLSFGFQVPPGGDTWERVSGQHVRTLRNVILVEISPCAFPAYPQTSIVVGDSRAARVARLQAREACLRRERRLRLLELQARCA